MVYKTVSNKTNDDTEVNYKTNQTESITYLILIYNTICKDQTKDYQLS